MEHCKEINSAAWNEEQWTLFQETLALGLWMLPAGVQLSQGEELKLKYCVAYAKVNPDHCSAEELPSRLGLFFQWFLGHEVLQWWEAMARGWSQEDRARFYLKAGHLEDLWPLIGADSDQQKAQLRHWCLQLDLPLRERARVIKNRGAGLSSALLGVDVTMTWEEIRRAFRRAVLLAHPDQGGSNDQIRALLDEMSRLKGSKGFTGKERFQFRPYGSRTPLS
jgi:hypothetical protein